MARIQIFKILTKALDYTKNHKFLWFFGFFLTGGGLLNFSRLTDFRRLSGDLNQSWHFFSGHPVYLVFALIGIILGLFVIFILIGISRSAVINATVRLERHDPQPIGFRSVLRHTRKYFFKVALISFFANLGIVIIFAWLFAPILYLIRQGLDLRAFFLALVGTSIFIPILIIVSMVNIFAANFVVAFDLHIREAIKSAFDIFVRFWDRAVSLLFILFVVYFLLFFFSADLVSLLGLLAFGLSVLIKSLSAMVVFGLFSGLVTAILIFIILSLLVINAALNVFANIAWTLFFLEVVRASRLPEEPKAMPTIEPAV